jgi:Flp pilus assembly protein TadG
MPRVSVRLFGRRRDAGGVAVTVGILLSTGVLLGMSALVVDVGQLYVEREELQSAADAAAVAVAVDCLRMREAECGNSSDAERYANLNSSDGASKVQEVCGEDRLGWLPSCSVPAFRNLTACIGGLPENTRGWVQVSTRTERPTRDASTRFILPPVFAETLSGTNRGTSVGACSRVAWGTPDSTFALTVCKNLFDDATNDGEDLAPAPPATVHRNVEQKLLYSSRPYAGRCDDSDPTITYGAGRWPLDSDFGWEDRDPRDDPTSCDVDLSDRETLLQLAPDQPPYTPDACYFRLRDLRDSQEPVAVLVIDQVEPDWFEITGVAAFVITGYQIQDRESADSTLTDQPCSGDTEDVCVSGYFVAALIPDETLMPSADSPYGTFGLAPTLGASVMQTVG